jgi:hypothetical protein
MATGVATLILPKLIAGSLIREALADGSSCPPATAFRGSIAGHFANGGPTQGARLIHKIQADMLSGPSGTNVATRYGVNVADMRAVGNNAYVSKSSGFGLGLCTPPPPFTQAQWDAILANTSTGFIWGTFNEDDGAGKDLGFNGGASITGGKPSVTGDMQFGFNSAKATWATGPSHSFNQPNNIKSISELTSSYGLPGNVQNNVNQSQAATSKSLWQMTSNSAQSLGGAISSLFGLSARKYGSQVTSLASCGLAGNAILADPTYGNSLFNPMSIPALANGLTLNSIPLEFQALLAAHYQSAMGIAAGVFSEFGGRDYHGTSPQNVANNDVEEGQAVAMWLAACYLSGTKGAYICMANGQAIANGVQATTLSNPLYGVQNVASMSPVATGDAGGAYNKGFVIVYDPKGSLPEMKTYGTINSANGNATPDSGITTVPAGVGALFLSALAFIGVDPGVASATMGVNAKTLLLPNS